MIVSVESTEAQQQLFKLSEANKELSRTNKKRLAEMTKMEAYGKRNTDAFRRLSESYRETNKQIEENNKKMDVHRGKVDLTHFSYSELSRESRRLRSQINHLSKELYPEEWNQLNGRLKQVTDQMKKVDIGSQSLTESLRDRFNNIASSTALWTTGLRMIVDGFTRLIRSTTAFISEGIRLAGVAQGIDDAFQKIADKDYLGRLRADTKGLLDDYNLKKYTVQANNLGINIEHMGKLLGFAQQRAKDTGESVEYLAQSIVTGLGRKSALILDNLGLSAAEISEEFKRTGDFTLAVSNIIDREMAKVGESVDTAAEAVTRKEVAWKNLQVQVGTHLIGFKETVDKGLASLAISLGQAFAWILKHSDALLRSIKALTIAISVYVATTKISIILSKLHAFWLSSLRLSTLAYAAAKAVLTNNISKARKAMLLFNMAMGSNPIAALIKVILALTAGIAMLALSSTKASAAQKSMTDINKKASDEFASQAGKVDALTKTIENNKLSIESRRKAIEQLRDIMPGYNATLNEEGKLINHNTAAIKQYLVQLEKQIRLKAAQEELEELYRRKRKQEQILEGAENLNKQKIDGEHWQTARLRERVAKKDIDKSKKELEGIEVSIAKVTQEISKSTIASTEAVAAKESLIKIQEDELAIAKQMPETTEAEIVAKNKRIEQIQTEINRLQALGKAQRASGSAGKKGAKESDRAREIRAEYDEELAMHEEGQRRAMLQLRKNLLEQKISQDEYDAAQRASEMATANKRLELANKLYQELSGIEYKTQAEKTKALREASNAILKAEEDVLQKRININEALSKLAQQADEEAKRRRDAIDAPNKMREQYGLTDAKLELKLKLDALDAYHQAEMEKYKDQEETRKQLTEVYAQARKKIELDAEREKLQDLSDLGIVGMMKQFKEEMKLLKKHEQAGLISAEAAERKKGEMRMAMAQKVSNALVSAARSMMSLMQDSEMAVIDRKYQGEIEAAQGNSEKLREIEERKEADKLAIQKKYADVDFAIKASEIVANTAIAIMKALSTLGPIAGPIAAGVMGATGLVQLAIANKERERVKNLQPGAGAGSSASAVRVASGREDGGYIDVEREQDGRRFRALHEPRRRGYVDRPTVIVGEGPAGQSREWVASHAALENPTIAPIISMLDAAQLSGRIRSIDMNAVMARIYQGRESGGFISPAPSGGSAAARTFGRIGSSDRNTVALERFARALERMSDEGIPATVVYSELQRKQSVINKTKKIASRS